MEKQKNREKLGRRYDRDFKRDAVALVQRENCHHLSSSIFVTTLF
jgi:hypothetical protein